jgi:hypothetical protein
VNATAHAPVSGRRIPVGDAIAVLERHGQRPEGGDRIHCFTGGISGVHGGNWQTVHAIDLARSADVAMWCPDVFNHCLWLWVGRDMYRFGFCMPEASQ